MESLEDKLEGIISKLELKEETKQKVYSSLNIIKNKDEETYLHCLRVGELSYKIADLLQLDKRVLYCAGLLHDVGKVMIDNKILKKKNGFSEEDYENMKKHSIYGYWFLKETMPLIAEVVLRHHYFNKISYPEPLPLSSTTLSETTLDYIDFYARLISIADIYDALKTRDNEDKEGDKYSQAKTNEQKKQLLLEENNDIRWLIKLLYKHKIFD